MRRRPGNGNALPLADHCADLLTYAQAWHWTLWWNTDPLDVPWIGEAARRTDRHFRLDLSAEKRDGTSCGSSRTGSSRRPTTSSSSREHAPAPTA